MSDATTAGAPGLSADEKKAAAKGRQLIPDDEAARKQLQRMALLGAAGLLAGALFAGVGVVIGSRMLSKRANAKFKGKRT